ncbi:MAG: hypothetical protein GY942_10570, partial [Aestuariibacter sp.]|nr:hypothetical protein [Aestuariibacter sp.]
IAGEAAYQEAMLFSQGLGLTSQQLIDTKAGLLDYIQSLEAQGLGNSEAAKAAWEQVEAIDALEKARARAIETMNTVADSLARINVEFDVTHPKAILFADDLIKMAGGLDEFTRQSNFYFENFFTQEEKKNILLRDGAIGIAEFNKEQGLYGDKMITTKEGLRAFIEAQDASTEAGRRAIAGALAAAPAFDAVGRSGQTFSEILSSLPQEWQDFINGLMSGTDDVGDSVDTTSQSLKDAAIDVGAFNEDLNLTGEAAIDTTAELDAYIAAQNLATQAGRDAAEAAEALRPGIELIESTGLSIGELLATLSGDTGDFGADMAANSSDITAAGAEINIALRDVGLDLGVAAINIDASGGAIIQSVTDLDTNLKLVKDGVIASSGDINTSITGVTDGFTAAAGIITTSGTTFNTTMGDMSLAANDASIKVAASSGATSASLSGMSDLFDIKAGDITTAGGVVGTAIGAAAGDLTTGAGNIKDAGSTAGSALGTFAGAIRAVGEAASGAASKAAAGARVANSAAKDASGYAGDAKRFSDSADKLSKNIAMHSRSITESSNATLGSFAIGTDYVPRTGPYLLHRGEAVTPAAQVNLNKSRTDSNVELRAIRSELQQLRADNARASNQANNVLSSIDNGTNVQNNTMKKVEKSNAKI